MLVPVPDRVELVACGTCRLSAEARDDADGRRGGAVLADLLAEIATEPAYRGIAVSRMPCLFACAAHCTVHLRSPGRVGYVLGRFAATEAAARAILDYAAAYADSEEGQVPYRDWPEGVKGHFLVRVPPAGALVA